MPNLVYIKQIEPYSLLHWFPSNTGGYVNLRDFSKSETEPPIPIKRNLSDAEALLATQTDGQSPQNFISSGHPIGQDDPGIKGSEAIKIWHDYICAMNERFNLVKVKPTPPLPPSSSLWQRIKEHPIVAAILLIGALAGAFMSIKSFIGDLTKSYFGY